MRTVNLDTVDKQLAELLSIAETSDSIVIAKNGRALARLSSVRSNAGVRTPGRHRDLISVSDDFDSELPDGFWLGDK